MVRTTLTLDDDVAAKLRAEARDSGEPFRRVVNEAIRWGLARHQTAVAAKPFRVTARDLGELRPGLSALVRISTNSRVFRRPLSAGQAAGPLVTDAALAALAIDHGATLYTTDRDFSRFSGLEWKNPIEER